MKRLRLPVGGDQLAETNQSEIERIIKKFPYMFENNGTIKHTEINIQLNPGQYPINQNARPIPLHLQDVGRQLEKLIKAGHLEKVKNVNEDCFVVITVKNDKSVKLALDSQKLKDNCAKRRPHVPNIKELLNQGRK